MQTLSLITASYNRAHTIRDTIRSVNMQTYPAIDHIVIDGGSTDGSMDIVREEAERLSYAVSEPDKGFYDAYNKGLAAAKGDIIGFINSDDFYIADDVIAQVMAAFEDPSVDAVYGDLYYVSPDATDHVERVWRSRPPTKVNIARGHHPAHPALFLRKSVYDRAGVFSMDYNPSGDVEFMMRIFHTLDLKAVHIPRPLVRMRSGGATGGNFSSIMRQNKAVRRAQRDLGIHYPAIGFALHKIVDRVQQKMRARSVRS